MIIAATPGVAAVHLVAAGLALHVAIDQLARWREPGDPVVRWCLAAFAASTTVVLVTSGLLQEAPLAAQPALVWIQLLGLTLVWVCSVTTALRISGLRPSRWLWPVVSTALVSRLLLHATGGLVTFTADAAPVTTSAARYVVLPLRLIALLLLGSLAWHSIRRSTGRRNLWLTLLALIVLSWLTTLVSGVSPGAFVLAVLPALWWSRAAIRTNERRIEAEAQQARREADALVRELSHTRSSLSHAESTSRRLVDAASHELRTPLTAILGGVELLGRADVPDDAHALARDLLSRNARRLHELIEHLLAAQAFDTPSRAPSPVPVPVDEALQTAIALQPVDDIDVVCPPSAVAWADPVDLTLIVAALVTNAVRHGGSRVRITVEVEDDHLRLMVDDDGAGIDEDLERRLFERFEQATSGLQRTQTGGLGLGLAVARTRARANGGDLRYRRENGWTRFELRVPRTGSAAVGRRTRVT